MEKLTSQELMTEYTACCLTVSLPRYRFINFNEAIQVNSAGIHLMGFLVLLATVQLWNLLHHNPRLQLIRRTLSKAWDEVLSFLLVILILLTGYAITVSRPSRCLSSKVLWSWNHVAPLRERVTIWTIISSSWQ